MFFLIQKPYRQSIEEAENRFWMKASSSAIEGTFNPLTKIPSSDDEGIFIK